VVKCLRRSSGLYRRVDLQVDTDVSEKHTASKVKLQVLAAATMNMDVLECCAV
jgi:hypothetical protein